MSRLIAFAGPAGSGKSTAADALAQVGYCRIRFAAPLKAMLHAFYQHCGLPHHEIERRIEGDLKQSDDPLLGGATPRYAMQTLGTEWGREMIWDELWVNAWKEKVQRLLDSGLSVVVEDCRFANEAAAIRELGGAIIMLVGRGGIAGDHPSEQFDFDVDERFYNVSTEEEFRQNVVEFYSAAGQFWDNFDGSGDSPLTEYLDSLDLEEVAARVMSCTDVAEAVEIIRSTLLPDTRWASDLGLNEAEQRVLDGMLQEYEDALGRKPVFVSTRHVTPYIAEQQALDIPEIRPGVSSEEARDRLRGYLNGDPNRLAHAQQAMNHLGKGIVLELTDAQRVRFVFYLDCDSAGIPWTFGECDDYLSKVIGGEQ